MTMSSDQTALRGLMEKGDDGLYAIPVRPCPPWCVDTVLHINEHPADRRCYSDPIRFAESKGEPVFYDNPIRYAAPEVEVLLTRRPTEDDTLVLVHHGEGTRGGDAELFLTVNEAEAMIQALESALATHRTAVTA